MAIGANFSRVKTRGAYGRRLGAIVAIGAFIATLLTAVLPTSAAPAFAISGSDFQPGNIISDVVMYNKSTMSAAAIQAFLVAREPSCNAGFTCLKDYKQNTTNYAVPTTGGYVQNVCAPYVGAANESAATIIYKVAQYCGVNPQVILVTLQKEESLVTSPAPSAGRYRSAMGYGCPDTAACDSDFYGFFKQVYWGARAMQRPVSNYKPGAPKAILYNPNSKCGTRSVTIANKATANLYTYTPYTPNAKALANLTGKGDSCSSYGNRNFWVYFNNWFGSTVIPQINIQYVQATFQDVLGRAATTTDQYKYGRYLMTHSPRALLPSSFLASPDYRTLLINSTETALLGAAPSPADLAAELKLIANGTLAQDDLVPQIFGGTAYYTKVGSTPTGFVTGVYEYADGREPTPTELSAGITALIKTHRGSFAKKIWHSDEALSVRIQAEYGAYLLRQPTPIELSTMLNFMHTHTQASGIARILGTTEYLLDAQARFPVTTS